MWQRLQIPTMQGYGLSETSPTLTKGLLPDWARYNGSVGRLLPNLEAKFVLDGREVAPGEEGELWVRGPNVFPGYLNRPDLQAETFDDADGGGFFRTGDIGYVDSKGNVYITDRLKELIKYSKCPPHLGPSLLFMHRPSHCLRRNRGGDKEKERKKQQRRD